VRTRESAVGSKNLLLSEGKKKKTGRGGGIRKTVITKLRDENATGYYDVRKGIKTEGALLGSCQARGRGRRFKKILEKKEAH